MPCEQPSMLMPPLPVLKSPVVFYL